MNCEIDPIGVTQVGNTAAFRSVCAVRPVAFQLDNVFVPMSFASHQTKATPLRWNKKKSPACQPSDLLGSFNNLKDWVDRPNKDWSAGR